MSGTSGQATAKLFRCADSTAQDSRRIARRIAIAENQCIDGRVKPGQDNGRRFAAASIVFGLK
jgi:hypothetical protein